LERIKHGIKTLDTETTIDGNDMADHGWTTIESRNRAIAKVLAGRNPDEGWQPFV
jgi:hypothetical protein